MTKRRHLDSYGGLRMVYRQQPLPRRHTFAMLGWLTLTAGLFTAGCGQGVASRVGDKHVQPAQCSIEEGVAAAMKPLWLGAPRSTVDALRHLRPDEVLPRGTLKAMQNLASDESPGNKAAKDGRPEYTVLVSPSHMERAEVVELPSGTRAWVVLQRDAVSLIETDDKEITRLIGLGPGSTLGEIKQRIPGAEIRCGIGMGALVRLSSAVWLSSMDANAVAPHATAESLPDETVFEWLEVRPPEHPFF
jgi:hypothetical protein